MALMQVCMMRSVIASWCGLILSGINRCKPPAEAQALDHSSNEHKPSARKNAQEVRQANNSSGGTNNGRQDERSGRH